MNRRLVLVRHAKSAWPDLPDHERPLAKRGRRDAPVVGHWLREAGLAPDLVVCSTALRTRQTWQLMAPEVGGTPPQVSYEERVYAATSSALLALVRRTEAAISTLMVIGHNPGIEDLALMLAAAPADAAATAALQRATAKFPTAAVAVLDPAGAWSRLRPGCAPVIAFVTPSELLPAPPDSKE